MPDVDTVNNFLGILVVIAQIVTLILALSLLIKNDAKEALNFFAKKAHILTFLIALTSMLGSLYYSQIVGYEPCILCWYQRILMYPLVFLVGFALLKKRTDVTDYALVLSSLGTILSGYHFLLQAGFAPSIVCPAVGNAVSCVQEFVMQFGYISIPMMSFSGFALITTLLLISKNSPK